MDDHSDSSSVESTSAEVATVTPNCPLSPIPENLVETVRKSCHVISSQLTTALEEMIKSNEQLQKEIDVFKFKVEHLEVTSSQLTTALEEMIKSNEQQKKENDVFKSKVDHLQVTSSQLTTALEEMIKSNEQQKKENDVFKSKVDHLEVTSSQLTTALEEMIKSNEQQKKENDVLKSKVDHLEEMLTIGANHGPGPLGSKFGPSILEYPGEKSSDLCKAKEIEGPQGNKNQKEEILKIEVNELKKSLSCLQKLYDDLKRSNEEDNKVYAVTKQLTNLVQKKDSGEQ